MQCNNNTLVYTDVSSVDEYMKATLSDRAYGLYRVYRSGIALPEKVEAIHLDGIAFKLINRIQDAEIIGAIREWCKLAKHGSIGLVN